MGDIIGSQYEFKRPDDFDWQTAPLLTDKCTFTDDTETIKIDASDTVDMATEDLYEDARDSISDECIDELQEYLNEWCKRCGIGETYYFEFKEMIKNKYTQITT